MEEWTHRIQINLIQESIHNKYAYSSAGNTILKIVYQSWKKLRTSKSVGVNLKHSETKTDFDGWGSPYNCL